MTFYDDRVHVRRVACGLLAAVVMLVAPSYATGQTATFTVPALPAALGLPDSNRLQAGGDWLVRFDLRDVARLTASATTQIQALLAAAGVTADVSALPLPASVRVQVPTAFEAAALRGILEAFAPIVTLLPNRRWRAAVAPDDPFYERQWALRNSGQILPSAQDMQSDGYSEDCDSNLNDAFMVCDLDPGLPDVDLGAEIAWGVRTDAGSILVAVVDSGVDLNHPDLLPNLWHNSAEVLNGVDDDGNGFVDDVAGWDACDDDGAPDDLIGHGTQVAGIIAARGNDSFGISGVAWGIQVVGVKFIGPEPVPVGEDCNLTTAALDALEFARVIGADVVNMSWGGPENDPFLREKLVELVDAGIVLIAATGNDGVDLATQPFFPAAYQIPGLLSVAAHTNDGRISSFSNFGGNTDLAAPGMSVFTDEQAFEDAWSFRNFNGFTGNAGTAQALPAGPILGTDFNIGEVGGQWGIAGLSNDSIAIIGDIQAAVAGNAHDANLNQTLVSNAFDAAAWGQALLRFGIIHDLGNDAEVRLEYSVDAGATWVPAVAGTFTGLGANEIVLDFAAMIGEPLPADLRIRFRFRTSGAHQDSEQVDTLAGGVYIFDVAWLRLGDETFDYVADSDRVFRFVQGTSFAAPYAAGAAALLRAQFPQMAPADVANQIVARAGTLQQTGSGVPFDRRLDMTQIFDVAPLLIWRGTPGFGADGVNPDTVGVGEPITFAVSVLDPNHEAEIVAAGVEIRVPDAPLPTYIPLSLDGLSSWTASTTFAKGGSYEYRFVITDAAIGELGGEPTLAQMFAITGDLPDSGGAAGDTTDNGLPDGGSGGCTAVVGAGHDAAALPTWLLLLGLMATVLTRGRWRRR